jgi:hypothetical protein
MVAAPDYVRESQRVVNYFHPSRGETSPVLGGLLPLAAYFPVPCQFQKGQCICTADFVGAVGGNFDKVRESVLGTDSNCCDAIFDGVGRELALPKIISIDIPLSAERD